MTAKAKLQKECAALGLSTTGTTAQLEASLRAAAEALEDTAVALSAPASKPASKTSNSASKLPVHPVNAAMFGGVVGAAWHLFG